MNRTVRVYGPAYLDRVLRVDRPLLPDGRGGPLDASVDGRLGPGAGLEVCDPIGRAIVVTPPDGWPGPWGRVAASRELDAGGPAWRREVAGCDWHDDLGGMGAGFAAALGGTLASALGEEADPIGRAVAALIDRAGIAHRPIRVPGTAADWTLLITSAGFGDKLPIGFRGCHVALRAVGPVEPSDLRVVAALPNRLAAAALAAPGAAVRVFAPAMRNVLDRDVPLASFAGSIDALSLNRREWEEIDAPALLIERIPLIAITDGPNGSRVHFRDATGRPGVVGVPAFPRRDPPRDTNRAGEAYAATLLEAVLDGGWSGGAIDAGLVRAAATRASAAAALVLDRASFGFPAREEIDRALRDGIVAAGRA